MCAVIEKSMRMLPVRDRMLHSGKEEEKKPAGR